MNIYININDIKHENKINIHDSIRYLYPKKNTIMEGEFTKILFSMSNVTLNGLYLYLPLTIEKNNNDNHIRYIVNNTNNMNLIQDIKMLEVNILNNYKSFNKRSKHIETIIARQLNTGTIKVYHDNNNKKKNRYVMKISGIWETKDKIGITYKILEL